MAHLYFHWHSSDEIAYISMDSTISNFFITCISIASVHVVDKDSNNYAHVACQLKLEHFQHIALTELHKTEINIIYM